jgi:hypothetical protein
MYIYMISKQTHVSNRMDIWLNYHLLITLLKNFISDRS